MLVLKAIKLGALFSKNKLLFVSIIATIIIAIYIIKESFVWLNKKIIIPDIIGGLGNQLFVVAAAFAYTKNGNNNGNDNGNTYKLMLDNRKDVYSYGKPRPTYNSTVFSKIPVSTVDISHYKKLTENEYNINIINNNNNNNKEITDIFLTGGYYQEAKYFNKYRDELLKLLEPSIDTNTKLDNICKSNNIIIGRDYLIAIHIRLDDIYTPIDNDKRVYDRDEYDIIISKLPEHIKSKSNAKFILFSNDITRTKEIFINSKINKSRLIYIQTDDYVELLLMSKCNDYIASPSTFNWWGIYLNPNSNKKVFIYWKQDSNYRKNFYKKYEYLKDENIINKLILNENSIEHFYNNINDNINDNINSNSNSIKNNFTCVSGYWNVNNKHGNKFNDWFINTLDINCPYVFFTTEDNINNIRQFRKNYLTYFVSKNIIDFKTYKLNMTNEIHSTHVPSKDLGLVWLEKMNLVLEASQLNPYSSEWFCWVDAGICVYRENKPSTNIFPNPEKMRLLSKTQINYSTSETISKEKLNTIRNWENVHNIAGGAFILHISIVSKIYDLFYKYLNICIHETNKFTCYSVQCILARIYIDYPELFNKIGDEYGRIILELS